MDLIAGSTPRLSVETDDLLARRLRSASLLLFAGYLAFFIKSIFYADRLQTTLDWTLFADHGLMTLITGLVAVRLCTNCEFALKHLRIVELVVFGGSALFFLVLSYWILTNSAPKNYLVPITPMWMILIFTYALFIPNTLRRALMVIGAMAATPILLCIVLRVASSDFANVVQTNEDFHGFVTQIAMVMILTAATAIWGAFTIGSLRREAFEAKQLGQYRLKEKIGEGGMGEVYLAEHLLLKRPCAIKLIRPEQAGDTRALARFEREVKETAKLTHWNTIEIYDYGRSNDGTFYYAMEYLPGHNLGQLVEMSGPLPAGRAIHFLLQACEALSEAHHKGLIHRDIKPANIFAAHRGGIYDVVKLLDFGLAKTVSNLPNSELTVEGSIAGSPLYMAPEQVDGDQPIDARSDIYSLGVVAYYLLTGTPPFEGSNPFKVLMAHVRDEPLPLAERNGEIPMDLQQIVMRCLEKEPDHRFQSAESLREALRDCEAAGTWTRESARQWWECNGCPQKKAMDAAVLEAAAI